MHRDSRSIQSDWQMFFSRILFNCCPYSWCLRWDMSAWSGWKKCSVSLTNILPIVETKIGNLGHIQVNANETFDTATPFRFDYSRWCLCNDTRSTTGIAEDTVRSTGTFLTALNRVSRKHDQDENEIQFSAAGFRRRFGNPNAEERDADCTTNESSLTLRSRIPFKTTVRSIVEQIGSLI